MKHRPPRFAERFLEWYCNPSALEEIQGDIYELFKREAKKNHRKASLLFVWNVLRFFRWRNIRKDRLRNYTPTTTAMIRSYFITGFRNMVRNAVPSIINITGLSVAIGCAILVFILEDSFYNLDAMHEKHERIALITNYVKEGDGIRKWATSPHALAPLLETNSAVEKTVRAKKDWAAVRVGEKVFTEDLLYVDTQFLDVFSFRTISGSAESLHSKNQVIITELIAVKYFGNKDVVGQALSFKFENNVKQEFTVGAVLEDIPANSSMYFGFLVPMPVWEDRHQQDLEDWSVNPSVTFVLMKDGHSFSELEPSLTAYRKLQNKVSESRSVEKVVCIPLMDVAHESYDIAGSLSWSNAPAGMITIAVIGIFLLLLACFNYMNVAVASVSTRLKEIGIRKVVGGGRGKIIQQFLVENLLLCSISLTAGIALAYFFLVPGFDLLFPIHLEFEISSWKMMLLFFGGLLGFVALVSGAYPALYVSSFNAVKIIRGKEKFGGKSMFSKILLTVQFTLSITTLVACLVFIWTNYYLEGKDWGYNQENIAVSHLQAGSQFQEMKGAIATNKHVVSVAGAKHHIGSAYENVIIKILDKDYSAAHFAVGFNYLESMNIRLLEGRSFDENIASDKTESVVINQAFVEKMGWKNPVGETFVLDSIKMYVAGIAEDFYYRDFYWRVEPAFFTITAEENFDYLIVKTDKEAGEVLADLKTQWMRLSPDDPFEGFLQHEVFDSFKENLHANNIVIAFTSGIAVLLAAMGLYGLISYNLTRRMKEFSVRKIFGADTFHIFKLMSHDYRWIVLIAMAVGAPLGASLMNSLVRAVYPEHIPSTLLPYIISVSVVLFTVLLTIALQLKRIVFENPTQTLRSE